MNARASHAALDWDDSRYPRTINGISLRRYDQIPDGIAWYQKSGGTWHAVSTRETFNRAERIGMALLGSGTRPQDKVAIVANTRPEWVNVDSALLSIGAVVVGIYPTATPDQMAYILQHSEAQVVFLENAAQLTRLKPFLADLPQLRHIVLIDGEPERLPEALQSRLLLEGWQTLLLRGQQQAEAQPGVFRQNAEAVKPDDIATLVYTSGTTGHPKGAILTHRNFFEVVTAFSETFATKADEISLIFLPLAHVLQRFAVYLGMIIGGTGYFAEGLDRVQDNLGEVKPTVLASVPRILEKIHDKVMSTVEASSPLRQRIFHRALRVGQQYHHWQTQHGQQTPRPLSLRVQYRLAEKVVFSKIKSRLGGRLDRMVSGGAPLAPHLSEFFYSMGILVIEGYGLTETCAPCTTNTPDAFRFGTVGRALPGVHIAIAEDGEILIKSPGNFIGYFKDPEATAAALKDGWFYSGDIGELDADGFLRITDRKKDIIITAAGKNIAPQELENRLKQHRIISNVMIHGDKRPYLTALLTLDEEEVRRLLGDSSSPLSALVHSARVQAEVKKVVDGFNASVAPYETIKKFQVLPDDFSVERGELTPTLKLKRKALTQHHQALLDGFYAEGHAPRGHGGV